MSSRVAARRGAWQSDATESEIATSEVPAAELSPLAITEAQIDAIAQILEQPSASPPASPPTSLPAPTKFVQAPPPNTIASLDERGLRELIRSVVEEPQTMA